MMLGEMLKKNKLLTMVILVYVFLSFFMPDKAYSSIKNSWYYIIEMLQIMPVVFILTSIIEAWVPKEIIINSFGEKSGIKGVIFSFILGSFSAGPIYAAFPISKMLLEKGASVANIVIILSSWAVIKVPMLANEAKFLGIKFMTIRWILTVVSILVMSYIVALFVKKESIPTKKVNTNEVTKLQIADKYCIGCGLCEKALPQLFEMTGGKARWKESSFDNEHKSGLEFIITKCPVKAISLN